MFNSASIRIYSLLSISIFAPMLKQVISLLHKDFLIEWKHKSGFAGVILYSMVSIYCCYLVFRQALEPATWNALFWIIMLFAATNAIAKSFMSESRGLQLFYYSLLNARAVIIAKSIYNISFLFVITIINLLVYITLLGNVVHDLPMFLCVILLGVSALAIVLTLVSAIVARANNSATLIAILGFPLLIPLLITIIRCSRNAIDGLGWAVNQPYIIVLVSLNVLCMGLSYLLFPYLWRD